MKPAGSGVFCDSRSLSVWLTPQVCRTDLLRAVIYPDSDDTTSLGSGADGLYDRVEHQYNRQGELIWTKDQNGTIHEFTYDLLGRPTTDRATTTLGSGIDESVRSIERSYEVRGMVNRVTSLDASGWPVNEVAFSYDHFGLLVHSRPRAGRRAVMWVLPRSHREGAAAHVQTFLRRQKCGEARQLS